MRIITLPRDMQRPNIRSFLYEVNDLDAISHRPDRATAIARAQILERAGLLMAPKSLMPVRTARRYPMQSPPRR